MVTSENIKQICWVIKSISIQGINVFSITANQFKKPHLKYVYDLNDS